MINLQSDLQFLPDENCEKTFKNIVLSDLIIEAKDKYWKKTWEQEPEWDRVGVTTLFTFYWDITIETINWAKKLVKDTKNLMVGGVLASIQPEELAAATGLHIHKKGQAGGVHVGILRAGDLDADDTQNIDELELDYSILDEIDYKYPMSNAYYRYTTRGCVRKCQFCAVKTLEPIYQDYIPLKTRVERVRNLYGEQKDLILMDNNVLASKRFNDIIQEIKECGFEKGAKFKQPNLLDIAIRNLKEGINDRAYIRKSYQLISDFYNKVSGEKSYQVYCVIKKYHLYNHYIATKDNLIAAYDELKELYSKHHQPGQGKLRFIDFNQGLDARLFTQDKANLLGQIAIRPVRIAFDSMSVEKQYCNAIKMCVNAGIRDFSNYLLYNFEDHPDDLYNRLRINVDLCETLSKKTKQGVSIYSFPMKYHPIRKTEQMDEDFSHNRDYIGKHWNRKYIRAIQAILNSTKGKIGRGIDFFEKALGKNIDEYRLLLYMPETMIIYRLFFEWLGEPEGKKIAKQIIGYDMSDHSTQAWVECFKMSQTTLSTDELNAVLNAIHNNSISSQTIHMKPIAQKLLAYYSANRKDIISNNTHMFKLKEVYDKLPQHH